MVAASTPAEGPALEFAKADLHTGRPAEGLETTAGLTTHVSVCSLEIRRSEMTY